MNDKVKFIEQKPKPFPTIGQAVWIIILLFILTIIVYGPIKYIFLDDINKDIQFPILYLFTFGSILYYLYRKRKRENRSAKFNFKISNYKIAPILIVTVVAIFLLNIFIINLIPISDSMKDYLTELFKQLGIFSIIGAVIFAPIIEELIFRGVFLDGFLKQYSPTKAIIVSSILFGIVHFNPWQFVSAFIGGLFIGWVYYKTRSVSISIILHSVNNLTGAIGNLFDKDFDNIDASPIEMFGGMANSILLIIAAIFTILISIYYLNKIFSKENFS